MVPMIETSRLLMRPWDEADAERALEIYGDVRVSRWLSPVMSRILDEHAMRHTLRNWRKQLVPGEPVGHWALTDRFSDELVGGLAIRELETNDGDYEIAWQLGARHWGRGYAAEAGGALCAWALANSTIGEVLSLVRPNNQRAAATAQRIGMEWVGETEKFHGLRLQVFRIRRADLRA